MIYYTCDLHDYSSSYGPCLHCATQPPPSTSNTSVAQASWNGDNSFTLDNIESDNYTKINPEIEKKLDEINSKLNIILKVLQNY